MLAPVVGLVLLALLGTVNCRPGSTARLVVTEGKVGARQLQQLVEPSTAPSASQPSAVQEGQPGLSADLLASNDTSCLPNELGNLDANCKGQGALGSSPSPSQEESPGTSPSFPGAASAVVAPTGPTTGQEQPTGASSDTSKSQPEPQVAPEASPPPVGRTYKPGEAPTAPGPGQTMPVPSQANVGGQGSQPGSGGGKGEGLSGWAVGMVVAAAVGLAVLAGVAGFYGVRKHRNRHKQFKKFVSAHLGRNGGEGGSGFGGWGGGWGLSGGQQQQGGPSRMVELGPVVEKHSLASSCGRMESGVGLMVAPFPCKLPGTLPSDTAAHQQQHELDQRWPPRWDSAQSEADVSGAAQQAEQSKASRLSQQHYGGQQLQYGAQEGQQQGGFYLGPWPGGDDEEMEDATAICPMEAEDSPSLSATFHNPLRPLLLLPAQPIVAGREAGSSPLAPGTPVVAVGGPGVGPAGEAVPEPMDLESVGGVLAPNPWAGILTQGAGLGQQWWCSNSASLAAASSALPPQLQRQQEQQQHLVGPAAAAPAAIDQWTQFFEAAAAGAPPPGALLQPQLQMQPSKGVHQRAQQAQLEKQQWQQQQGAVQALGGLEEGGETEAEDSPVQHSTLLPPFPSNGTTSSQDECSPTKKKKPRPGSGSDSNTIAGTGTATATGTGTGACAAVDRGGTGARRGSGSGGTAAGGGGSGGGSGSGASTHLPALLGDSDWEISPDEIQICKRVDGSEWQLGAGAFGRVYKALRGGVTEVAVKVLAGDAGEDEGFRREVAILRGCRDVNVVQFLGACFQPGHTMLVCEYMAGGDLRSALSRQRASYVWGGGRGRSLAMDIARGLHQLHSRRIIHFDLKSNNILLSQGGTQAKIADVGLAAVVSQRYISLDGLRGAFAWAAPEVLTGEQRCSEKVDIYSLGVVLWELVTGEVPQRGRMREPRVPEECPPEIAELIDHCMAPSPAKRPSAKEIYFAIQASPSTTSSQQTATAAVPAAAAPARAPAQAVVVAAPLAAGPRQ